MGVHRLVLSGTFFICQIVSFANCFYVNTKNAHVFLNLPSSHSSHSSHSSSSRTRNNLLFRFGLDRPQRQHCGNSIRGTNSSNKVGFNRPTSIANFRLQNALGDNDSGNGSGSGSDEQVPLSKAPSFNGKTVFPVKVFMNGLKGHQVAAVYAILNKNYKRGGEGWEHVQHISITKDLYKDIEDLQSNYSPSQVAHVRALSFVYPQKSAMQEVANKWGNIVTTEYGGTVTWDDDTQTDSDCDSEGNTVENNDSDGVQMTEREKLIQLMKDTAVYDDDDDDDDDYDDEFEFDDDDDILSSKQIMETIDATKQLSSSSTSTDNEIAIKNEEVVVSPFDNNSNDDNNGEMAALTDSNGQLVFNADNVNKVLDEIRPYLINDGGNVSVQRVDDETRSVYLKLEGACGNCASSTVTMSMGITRVLKENFDNLGEVVQVDDEEDEASGAGQPKSLTEDAVMTELSRIGPAITAMGGSVEVVNVDPIGVVELRFRGSTKIQQGLELALRDVPYVKHVKFVS